MVRLLCFIAFAAVVAGCKTVTHFKMQPSLDNQLTAQEIKDGWKLLFDGKTMIKWHT
jgi:hypothetical protein